MRELRNEAGRQQWAGGTGEPAGQTDQWTGGTGEPAGQTGQRTGGTNNVQGHGLYFSESLIQTEAGGVDGGAQEEEEEEAGEVQVSGSGEEEVGRAPGEHQHVRLSSTTIAQEVLWPGPRVGPPAAVLGDVHQEIYSLGI